MMDSQRSGRPFYFYFLLNLFILFLAALGLHCCLRGLSLVAVSGGYSSLRCAGFSLWWLLLLRSTGSRARAQYLWHTGLVAPQHMGSSQTRAQTCVPCIGRWILNHCATGEVLGGLFKRIL